jgi:hypothetical protein
MLHLEAINLNNDLFFYYSDSIRHQGRVSGDLELVRTKHASSVSGRGEHHFLSIPSSSLLRKPVVVPCFYTIRWTTMSRKQQSGEEGTLYIRYIQVQSNTMMVIRETWSFTRRFEDGCVMNGETLLIH